jgi:hypothetical protein
LLNASVGPINYDSDLGQRRRKNGRARQHDNRT